MPRLIETNLAAALIEQAQLSLPAFGKADHIALDFNPTAILSCTRMHGFSQMALFKDGPSHSLSTQSFDKPITAIQRDFPILISSLLCLNAVIYQAHQAHALAHQLPCQFDPFVIAGHHQNTPRVNSVKVDQPAHSAGKENSWPIIVLKQLRDFVSTGSQQEAPGTKMD